MTESDPCLFVLDGLKLFWQTSKATSNEYGLRCKGLDSVCLFDNPLAERVDLTSVRDSFRGETVLNPQREAESVLGYKSNKLHAPFMSSWTLIFWGRRHEAKPLNIIYIYIYIYMYIYIHIYEIHSL